VKVYGGDYEEVVRKYDAKDTVFFLDPSYPGYNVDIGESAALSPDALRGRACLERGAAGGGGAWSREESGVLASARLSRRTDAARARRRGAGAA
jgi:hypothetical protein